jgi:hypothetical protein
MKNDLEQLKIKVKVSSVSSKKGAKYIGGLKQPKVEQGTLMDIKNSKKIASEEADFKKNINFIHREMIEYMMDNNTNGKIYEQELDIIRLGDSCF